MRILKIERTADVKKRSSMIHISFVVAWYALYEEFGKVLRDARYCLRAAFRASPIYIIRYLSTTVHNRFEGLSSVSLPYSLFSAVWQEMQFRVTEGSSTEFSVREGVLLWLDSVMATVHTLGRLLVGCFMFLIICSLDPPTLNHCCKSVLSSISI